MRRDDVELDALDAVLGLKSKSACHHDGGRDRACRRDERRDEPGRDDTNHDGDSNCPASERTNVPHSTTLTEDKVLEHSKRSVIRILMTATWTEVAP